MICAILAVLIIDFSSTFTLRLHNRNYHFERHRFVNTTACADKAAVAVTTTARDINIVLSSGVCLGASVPHSRESTLTLPLTLGARGDVVEQMRPTPALTKGGRRKCRVDVGVSCDGNDCRQRTMEEDRSNMSGRQPPSVQLVYVFFGSTLTEVDIYLLLYFHSYPDLLLIHMLTSS